ncbi:MAG: AbrB/MazE/SpoVT family DNA-binding domain-containing protein [Methanoregula sp.]
MEVGITRMSSKGQIVIPASMRTDLPEGEKLLIIRDGERYILKPLNDLEPALQEDILFAEKTEQAFEEYIKGMFHKKKAGDFIDEMSSW